MYAHHMLQAEIARQHQTHLMGVAERYRRHHRKASHVETTERCRVIELPVAIARTSPYEARVA